MAPTVILVAGDLGIDEAIDRLNADHRLAVAAPRPPDDLFGRPALAEFGQDTLAQAVVAVELAAVPAPRPGQLLGMAWLVADRAAGIALQLPGDGRWRAANSRRDLAERISFAR
jgi:hypothetical protein